METQISVLEAAHARSQSGATRTPNPRPRRYLVRRCSGLWPSPTSVRWTTVVRLAAVTSVLLVIGMFAAPSGAYAAEATVGLGTAASYSVLGGQTVTNTGPSTLSGDLGLSPGTAITGFPPGIVAGATHVADAQAAQAQSDLVIAYNDAAGRAKTASVAGDLVGKTLTAGVYKSTGPIALSGTLTLNGQGNPNSVFIFQAASTLITASASKVSVINDAQACNVFWQVGSSATLGTTSTFTGTIIALTSITVNTGSVVEGRALARNGAVTLDDDTFTTPSCKTSGTPPTTTTTPTHASTTTTTANGSATSTTSPKGGGVSVGGGVGSGGGSTHTGTPTGSSGLAMTGAGPALMALLGAGVALVLIGGLLLALGAWERFLGGRDRSFISDLARDEVHLTEHITQPR